MLSFTELFVQWSVYQVSVYSVSGYFAYTWNESLFEKTTKLFN